MLAKLFDKDWAILALVTLVIFLSVVFRCGTSVHAREGTLPAEQFTAETRLWLGRAMVSEAGWLATQDHAAIAHILYRRWKARQTKYPEVTFEQVIRHYCAGFYVKEAALTPRQLWIRQLDFTRAEPTAWPRQVAHWSKHLRYWQDILQRAELFGEGKLKDPCPGQAWHWGGTMDKKRAEKMKLVPVDCGETSNTFYALPPKEIVYAHK